MRKSNNTTRTTDKILIIKTMITQNGNHKTNTENTHQVCSPNLCRYHSCRHLTFPAENERSTRLGTRSKFKGVVCLRKSIHVEMSGRGCLNEIAKSAFS